MKNNNRQLTIFIWLLSITGGFTKESPIPGTLYTFHMHNGEERRGYVVGEKDDWIRVQLAETLPSVGPKVTVLLKRNSIQKIFPLEWDIWESAVKEENKDILECGWKAMSCLLGIPGSRIGELGNALANRFINLFKANISNKLEEINSLVQIKLLQTAQEIYTLIEIQSPHSEEQIVARLGRLRIQTIQGKNNAVRDEAQSLIREFPDPPPEVWDILGESLLVEIEKLVQEHPCWEQDRFVKPQIFQLLSSCLDVSLIPFIRYPCHEKQAAQGLLRSIRIHCIAKNTKLAQQAVSDLNIFYPQFQERTEEILKQLKLKK